jgi:hypothetical protein
MICGVVDLDILFQIRHGHARIMVAMKRKQALKDQQWSMRERANLMVDLTSSRRKKGYL